MIAQAIAQIVDSYLTNSQKSRESASQTETNLNQNIGAGDNQSQLGGDNTASNIPSDSGLSNTVHEVAGAIGAASKAKDDKGGKPKKDKTIADEAKNAVTGGAGGAVNKALQNAAGAGDAKNIGGKFGSNTAFS